MDGARLVVDADRVSGAEVIRISGELDVAAEERFRAFFDGHEPTGAPIEIDLSGVTFLDSRGLSIVVRAVDALRAGGHAACVVDMAPQGLRLLEMTGLRDHLMGGV